MKKVKHFFATRLLGESSLINEEFEESIPSSGASTSCEGLGDGVEVALIGTDNSGKTTLVNALGCKHMGSNIFVQNTFGHIRHRAADIIVKIAQSTIQESQVISLGEFKDFLTDLKAKDHRFGLEKFTIIFKRLFYELWWDASFQDLLLKSYQFSCEMEFARYIMRKKNYDRILQLESLDEEKEDFLFRFNPTSGFGLCKLNDRCVLVDFGGSVPERQKWEQVTFKRSGTMNAVCCVVSLSAFDENNNETNGLSDSLNYFSHVLRRIDRKFALYVLFTKLDVLEKKIQHGIKLSDFYKDFGGDNSDVLTVKDFIIQQFLDLDTLDRIKKYHVISAFDGENLNTVFEEVFTECGASWNEPESVTEQTQKESANGPNVERNLGNMHFKTNGTLSKLPFGVIHTIMEFHTRDELSNILHVCKSWFATGSQVPMEIIRPNFRLFMQTRFQNVTSLNLQSTFIQSHQIKDIATSSKFKKLRYLNLSNNYLITSNDWKYLFEQQEFKDLKTLILSYCNLDSIKLQNICNNRFLQLTTLSLEGNHQLQVQDVTILKESSFVNTLTTLQCMKTSISNVNPISANCNFSNPNFIII